MTPRLAVAAFTAAAFSSTLLGPAAQADQVAFAPRPPPEPSYAEVVADVAGMISDPELTAMVARKGLDLVNVMWEDTGRWEGSSVGPNISDVTIEVEASSDASGRRTHLMPVMRHDNFTDKTGDVRMDRIYVPVGNEDGEGLRTITLRDLLADPGRYMSLPKNGKIKGGSLLRKRDAHVLVSAQHTFLPVPRDGKATFWPVIFNYQSYQDNPAVLTILVTRQGSSMTIVDNARDTVGGGGSWGQRLYFNDHGQKAPLIAERLKDVQRKGKTANGEAAASLGEDVNLLMIIQVPLKQRRPPRDEMAYGASVGGALAGDAMGAPMEEPVLAPPAPSISAKGTGSGAGRAQRRPDVDVAVLGHGETDGPFTELDGQTIARDPRFPVRVTVQFYQATATGVVERADVDRMAAQIARVYRSADYVGSLVVPGPGDKLRPTRWSGAGPAPADASLADFPGLEERLRSRALRPVLAGW